MHLSVNIVDCGKGDTLTATPSGGGKECTLTYTLLTVERDTASRPHCWWWKGKHSHVNTVDCKEIHPDDHTVDCRKGYNLTFTLLVVEGDTPSRPQLTIHTYVHTVDWK
jgi:hypothetical protein